MPNEMDEFELVGGAAATGAAATGSAATGSAATGAVSAATGAVDRLAPVDEIVIKDAISSGGEVPARHHDLAPGQGPADQISTVVRMAAGAARGITMGMSNQEIFATWSRVNSHQPPAQQLRAQQPPAQQLPAQQPPAQQPPAQQPPAQQPPAQQPPAQQTPVQHNTWNGYTQAEWNEWHALGNPIGTGVRKS